jgi:hypothetical protein
VAPASSIDSETGSRGPCTHLVYTETPGYDVVSNFGRKFGAFFCTRVGGGQKTSTQTCSTGSAYEGRQAW